jgi:NhaP-type Na+/H+ or K+/H+ antiporter
MSYLITLCIIGLAALGMAWMPAITKKTGISYSIIYLMLGVIFYLLFSHLLPLPDPISKNSFTLHLTELVVIVSIMGTGIKIDKPFSLVGWRIPFRLVIFTMLLCIFITAAIGLTVLDFDLASALLLGAALAPTDPVLASDVQVGPPQEKEERHVKFSLTAEAGMNDGTAFPFTWLAIAVAVSTQQGELDLSQWIIKDLLYRLIAATVSGFMMGRLLAYLLFFLPEKKKTIVTRDGFVAIASTLLVYGFTELIQGYGFIAVFVTAITLRNYEIHHKFHRQLHEFTDQIERMLVAIVLILFGGSLVSGLLDELSVPLALFGVAFVFIIRPATAYLSLIGAKLHRKEKLGISFFGIKGIGSFFYLAFAMQQTNFTRKEALWSLVAFIVLLSIIIHGLTATRFMKGIEQEFPVQEKDVQVVKTE